MEHIFEASGTLKTMAFADEHFKREVHVQTHSYTIHGVRG